MYQSIEGVQTSVELYRYKTINGDKINSTIGNLAASHVNGKPMSVPLLSTKVFIPPLGRFRVERPNLEQKLAECLQPGCRLALLSAPAGFGKTTLVSAWAASLKLSGILPSPSVAWVSLDNGDNDPVIFWSYIISSLQVQQAGVGKQFLDVLQSTQATDVVENLASLVNDLTQIPDPFILILDDYHLIRNRAIHRSLSYFIDHLPPQFHIMILSRTDPPLPLALLRGRDQLLEIRINDLRFSIENAAAFLNSGMRLSLPEPAIQALHLKTEGWVAGLQMAALSLREAAALHDHERIESLIASFSGSNRYILDYLIDEVLNQQTEQVQSFLLKTSILDRLCGPLCDALLQDAEGGIPPASQQVLEGLENSNLFILSLDDQRCWYRYHQLFSELLRKRLSQTEPGLVAELHRRAIQWYEQNGLVPKAVEHALLIKAFSKAASLINQIIEELWGRGEYVTLLAWLDTLPEDEKRKYHQLWIFQVSMLITAGKIHEAEQRIPEIENYLKSLPAEEEAQASVVGQAYSLRTYIASFYGDIPNLLRYAHLALNNLPGDKNAGGRCGISLVLSNAFLNNGDFTAAGQALTAVITDGNIAHKPSMVLTAMSNLAIVLYTQGDLKRASQVCQEGIQLVEQSGLGHSPNASNLFIGQGMVLCEQHELEKAESSIRRGLDLARERGYIWSIAWGYRALIRLRLAQGDLPAAEAAAHDSEQFLTSHEIPEYHACGLAGAQAFVWIRQGKIGLAERHLQSRNIRVNNEIRYPHETEYWALASLCLAKGDLASGASLLEGMLLHAESGKQLLWVIRARVLQALFFRAQGKRLQSLGSLGLALDLAEPEGYLQAFMDEGRPMARLLQEAIQENIHPEYCHCLLKAFPGVLLEDMKDTQLRGAQPGTSLLIEPLSQREIEIIHLIAEGLSNKEIAQKLYISVRTVKYYTTSIYTKMDVKGRSQAVIKARQLGLTE